MVVCCTLKNVCPKTEQNAIQFSGKQKLSSTSRSGFTPASEIQLKTKMDKAQFLRENYLIKPAVGNISDWIE